MGGLFLWDEPPAGPRRKFYMLIRGNACEVLTSKINKHGRVVVVGKKIGSGETMEDYVTLSSQYSEFESLLNNSELRLPTYLKPLKEIKGYYVDEIDVVLEVFAEGKDLIVSDRSAIGDVQIYALKGIVPN